MKSQTVLLFLLACTGLYAQTSISGVVNSYSAVTAIDYCAAKITVSNAVSFQTGQAVLLIQMQGATINESNSSSFGTVTSLGNAGKYERGRIQQISGSDIYLESELLNAYTISGKVQLVSIPEYSSAIVTGALTAMAWNGATGGVLALDAANTLTLNAPINADGKGFRGGQVQVMNSNCQWFLNEDDYFYEQSNWRGAKKGEGIAAVISGKESGRGPQANGGGGGNDHNAGGGGGSQTATGGIGGENTPESAFGCSGDYPGMGGKALASSDDRIFPGGGGGAGHADDAGTGTSGAPGGGIILIWAGAIDGQGFAISARGQDAAQATGDGAGGGGGGGTIIVQFTTLISAFDVLLKGGKGGNTQNFPDRCYAPGGGGSGGRLLRNGPVIPGVELNGGAPGVNTVASTECSTPYNGATAGNGGQQQVFPGVPEGNIPIVIPAITQQAPPQLVVCPGEPASIGIVAAGSNLSYQWQADTGGGFADLSNNASYNGVQTNTLQLLAPQAGWSGYAYRCLISAGCFAPLVSEVVTLQVETPSVPGFTFSVNGLTVQFQNTSVNADSLSWSFGDGAVSAEENPEHTYNSDGNYAVTLTTYNACGPVSITLPVQAGFPPEAAFSSDFTAGCAPLTVQFEDQSTGSSIVSREWFFPGGQPPASTLANPQVLYETPGVYDVTLIVGSGAGADTLTMEDYIEVFPLPQAFFTYTVSGDTVFFTNGSTGSGLAFTWNFGDGSPVSNAVDPVHVYPGPGAYEVTLLAQSPYCAAGISLFVETGPNAAGEAAGKRSPYLFPNPAAGELFIEMKNGPEMELRFWNAQGSLIRHERVRSGKTRIDVSAWPAGFYFVEWKREGQTGICPLIIMR